jgi:hypothetical protein
MPDGVPNCDFNYFQTANGNDAAHVYATDGRFCI